MKHKDHDNAVSALVAIQLQISATIQGEHDPRQSLSNIRHICNILCPKMDLPETDLCEN